MNELSQIIGNIDLFKGLNERETDALSQKILYSKKQYEAGSILMFQGDKIYELLILLSGTITAELPHVSGKILPIAKINGPNVISPVFMASKIEVPVTIKCVEKSVVAKLSKTEFYNLFRQNDSVIDNFLILIAKRLNNLALKVAFLNFKTIKKKFLYYLNGLAVKNNTVELSESISSLAEFFGVERPSLSAVISELVNDGSIKKEGSKKILILDYSIFDE